MSASVLVVDDDAEFVWLATEILNEMGIEVTGSAPTVAEALTTAKRLRPHAALVDVGLPDGDGIELAHRLAALPWRPRIVLTSSDPETAARLIDRDGGERHAFVSKAELPNAPLLDLLTGQ